MNDLEFLARYVPEWPNGATYVRLDRDGEICFLSQCADDCDFYPSNRDEAKSCFNEVGGGANTGPNYSESQWQAERARLQNKPGWNDAPEWADALVQLECGAWFWCVGHQKPNEDGGWNSISPKQKACGVGEVIGDWRDTLERRPESIEPEQPEWKQGELPPIGVMCEMSLGDGDPYTKGHVSFYGDTIFVWVSESGIESSYAKDWSIFRQLQTEEEKAIDDMHRIVFDNADKISVDDVCRILYRHGYRKLDNPDASN